MAMKRFGGSQETVLGEVLFEFQRHGNIMRVTAIDPKSGTEVVMIADPRHSQTIIKRLAMRKLLYVMNKKAVQAQKDRDLRS
ncbi:DUF6898 family protein [Magnetovibrio blakemorei]|nr:hypothetical protein [Magnetovibrio blakemorei]